MKFIIADDIFAKYPDLTIALVVCKGINNTGGSVGVIELIQAEAENIKSLYNKETLSENTKIAAWREAYSAFGAKPKNYKCSVENLYRMILDGIELRSINHLVDIYNYISLKHMIPAGGDDLDKIDGDITLKLARGSEKFIQLNSDEVKNPKEGEVVYADNSEILCRRWNWRECDKSKMTKDTKNIALVIEGLKPFTRAEIESIGKELMDMVQSECGGTCKMHILNSELTEATL